MFRGLKTVFCIMVLAMNAASPAFSEDKAPKTEKPSVIERPKIIISKETTRFTAPLREDGCLDCIKLLNEIAGKDVTPNNNAAYIYDLAAKKPLALKFVGGFKSPEVTEALSKLANDPKMDWNEVLRLSQAEWEFDEADPCSLNFQEQKKEIEKQRRKIRKNATRFWKKRPFLRFYLLKHHLLKRRKLL